MRRSINLLASLAMASTLLTGCSNQTNDNVLRIGMECNYAPFNWTTTSSNETTIQISDVDYADGYDVVIASMIGKQLGKEVQIVKLDWDNLILSLNNNQIDAIIAGMTDTEERREMVSFTSPYYESEEVIIVRKNSEYTNATSIQDFSGAKIQGQMNTIYDEVIDQINNVDHQPAAETFPAAIQALQSGAIDGVVSELPVAKGVVSANSDLTMVQFTKENNFEADTTVSIAVRKSDSELQSQIENALNNISQSQREEIMEAAVNRQPANE